ncbi:MAG TPA: cadherin repeat domain-containing protein, partial [Planctomycetaceae bacterium]|nr:cadherin repeat domain-containing protein [Planctomycetaceae bacterium]
DGLGTNALSLSGADAALFEIVGTSLFVKAGSELNFEAKSTFVVTVSADDTTLGGTPDASGNFTLTLLDVNEAPVMPGGVVRLIENSPIGTVVASGFATDPDAGQSLRYSIEAGNRNNAFAINPTTGVITVNNPAALDYENEPPYELKIAVIDNGTPNLKTTAVIRVFLTDANDAPSVYRSVKSIPENLPVGSVVLDYKIVAGDQDRGQTLTYAILSGNTNNAFAINPTTGVITVNNAQMMDYENQPPFELVIAVTDNGTPSLTSTAGLRIALTNENDAPRVYDATTSVPENAPVGSQVLDYKVVAREQDAFQSMTFAIIGGNRGDTFAIHPETGIITVKNSTLLDFETGSPFDLTISVKDNGTPSRTSVANLRVNIRNVNEAPKITDAATSIAENLPVGSLVFDLKTVATAPEPGQVLKYAITGGNRQNAFAINPATGVITVNNPAALNWESETPFELTVSVSDSVNAALTANGRLRVSLTNVNDAPTIVNAEKTIPENTAAGTVVFDAKTIASDADAGQTLKYAITAGNTGNAFAINATTGIITVSNAAAIDFEANPVFSLKITATDNGTPALSSTATLTIRLSDLREGPTITPTPFAVLENTAAGTVIGTLSVSALPAGQTRSFAITAGNTNNAFSINAAGQLVVNNTAALNFEVKPSFALTVAVTDTGTTANTSTAVINVTLTNVNEAPVIPPQSLAVRTGAATGVVVGTVSASDPDVGQTRSFAIVSGNGLFNNNFRINAATGQITVGSALAVLFARQYELTVRVTDNGSPALSSTAVVRIHVNATGIVPTREAAAVSSPSLPAASVVVIPVSKPIESDTVVLSSPGKPGSITANPLARLLRKGK